MDGMFSMSCPGQNKVMPDSLSLRTSCWRVFILFQSFGDKRAGGSCPWQPGVVTGGREGGKGSIFSMFSCVGLPFEFVLETVDKNREKDEEGILERWPLLS